MVLPRKDERVFPSTLSVSLKVEQAGGVFVRILGYFQRKTSSPFLWMTTIDGNRALLGLFLIVHRKRTRLSRTRRSLFADV
jgi:hypothetical protein